MYIQTSTKWKHLLCVVAIFSFLFLSAFITNEVDQTKGVVEGYVFPKVAKPKVVIAIPHPSKTGDTLHLTATPNAEGYFKLNNIPEGVQQIVYYPSNPALYKTKFKTISVVGGQTNNAGSITLDRQ